MTTDNPLEGKNRAQIGATAATCLMDAGGEDIETKYIDGYAPIAEGYIPTARIDEAEQHVAERMGDGWRLNVSHKVEEFGESMVMVEKADQ